ncbi:hypothetical protein XELAEV_18029872mg [Xenopus laevis]|uniref:Uncharacterized protein n=1 Tax=Xenopus laevis TaxID=8355 RepID=A0A974HIG9_XENLA|nr:hypothetical protein XELAEV_18029872mg [Xenopus laevis]
MTSPASPPLHSAMDHCQYDDLTVKCWVGFMPDILGPRSSSRRKGHIFIQTKHGRENNLFDFPRGSEGLSKGYFYPFSLSDGTSSCNMLSDRQRIKGELAPGNLTCNVQKPLYFPCSLPHIVVSPNIFTCIIMSYSVVNCDVCNGRCGVLHLPDVRGLTVSTVFK